MDYILREVKRQRWWKENMIHKILKITMIKKYREEALFKKKEADFLTISKENNL